MRFEPIFFSGFLVDLRGIATAIRRGSASVLFFVAGNPLPPRTFLDLMGLEPTTSSMPWRRATNCATGPKKCGALYPPSEADQPLAENELEAPLEIYVNYLRLFVYIIHF